MQYLVTKEKSFLKGIYKITNLINEDFYIGSTIQGFLPRFQKYKSSYKRYKEGVVRSFHPYLFNAFNKYGFDNFKFEIVEELTNDLLKVRQKEEEYILNLKPVYNICQHPTKGGSPNLGRLLSKEWRKKISEKSKIYRHSDNKEVFEKVSQKNKDTSSKYLVWKENDKFEGSLIDCAKYANVDVSTIYFWIKKKHKSRTGWNIKKLKSQKKKIRVQLETELIEFNSFGECDRHFNMWRGYTSTKTLQNSLLMEKYNYEVIKDIV